MWNKGPDLLNLHICGKMKFSRFRVSGREQGIKVTFICQLEWRENCLAAPKTSESRGTGENFRERKWETAQHPFFGKWELVKSICSIALMAWSTTLLGETISIATTNALANSPETIIAIVADILKNLILSHMKMAVRKTRIEIESSNLQPWLKNVSCAETKNGDWVVRLLSSRLQVKL